jgi:hypothetical protein
VKKTRHNVKRKSTKWEEIFCNYPSDLGLIFIYKKLKKSYNKIKPSYPVKNGKKV